MLTVGTVLMGYGFCLPDNPCDYYTVQLGVPPESPLATAKELQAKLKAEHGISDGETVTSKTVGSSYILNFDHPLRSETCLEHSIFSEDLRDNLSILCANDRELEHLTVSPDR